MSVTYQAVLSIEEHTVEEVARMLEHERARRGTRAGTRALEVREQAVLVLRWLIDDARMVDLARDNDIGASTAYAYRDEAVGVLAARRPSLHGALLAAKTAGHSHVIVDGTLIHTDRISTPGPTSGVDLWWSGKHHHHGGNIQVVSAPDGWPLWTSEVRPGREHDTTAARADPDLLARITDWTTDGHHSLADLGYQGEATVFTIPHKKPRDGPSSPSISRPSTPSTAPCAAWANERTHCSRPPSKRCAATADAPDGSAGSSPPPWSCSTSTRTAPPDQRIDHAESRLVTRTSSLNRDRFRPATCRQS